MSLTKDHLIDAIAKENGFQKKRSKRSFNNYILKGGQT